MKPDTARIDRICDAFERDWKSGEAPNIAEQLAEVPDELRLPLAQQLVMLDTEYRRLKFGAAPSLEEYAAQLELTVDDLAAAEQTTQLPQSDTAETVIGDLSDSATTDTAAAFQLPGYEILEELGRGGMGVVYKARQLQPRRIVAIKTIHAPQMAGREHIQRFYAEAEAAGRLDHRGIVPVFEVGEQNGVHYFSMGFVDGEDLEKKAAKKVFRCEAAARIIQEVAEALEYAHQNGVIHRDIKPHNILIDSDGRARVTDFGLAKLAESDADLTGSGQIMGTAAYMPPEQATGRTSEAGATADVYALGATLYRCVTGRPPFQAASAMEVLRQVVDDVPVAPRSLNKEVDADLDTLCLKCLEKQPEHRFTTAGEFSAELTRYLNGEPILSRPVGIVSRGVRWCRRKPAVARSIAAVILLLAITLLSLQSVRRSRHLAAAVQEFQSAAESDDYSEQHLKTLDQLAENIAAVDESEYRKAKKTVCVQLAAHIESKILQSNLQEQDMNRISKLLTLLAPRDQTEASRLAELRDERQTRWQPTIHLESPFANAADALDADKMELAADKSHLTFVDELMVTQASASGNARLHVVLQIQPELSGSFAVLFQEKADSGYECQVELAHHKSTADASGEATYRTAHLRIVRNGVIVLSRRIDDFETSDGTLDLTAQREGSRVIFNVGGTSSLILDDLFPVTMGQDEVFAVRFPEGAGLRRLTAARQFAPSKPTPLELGDQYYSTDQHGDALQYYETQLSTSNDISVRNEARFKKAMCLLKTGQTVDAIEVLEGLRLTESGRWAMAATIRLWQIYLEDTRLDEADEVFQLIQVGHDIGDIAPFIPQSTRDVVLKMYLASLRLSYESGVREVTEKRVEQLRRVADVSAELGATFYRQHELYWHVARGYESTNDPELAAEIIEGQLQGLDLQPHPDRERVILFYSAAYSRIQRDTGQAEKAHALLDKWTSLVKNSTFAVAMAVIRAHLLIYQGEWQSAGREIQNVRTDSTDFNAGIHKGDLAALTLGLIERQLGNEAQATEILEAAFEGQRAAGKLKSVRNRRDAWTLLILGIWSNSISDDEIGEILASVIGMYSKLNGDQQNGLVSAIAAYKSPVSPQVIRAALTSERGEEFAQKFVLDQLGMRERYTLPLQLIATEFLIDGTLGMATAPADYREAVWELAAQVLHAYQTDELEISDFVYLVAAWKGRTGILGWQSIESKLTQQPGLRSKLAYVLAHRFMRLGNADATEALLRLSMQGEAGNSELPATAQADLDVLLANQSTIYFQNLTQSPVEFTLSSNEAETMSVELSPQSEKVVRVHRGTVQLEMPEPQVAMASTAVVRTKKTLRQLVTFDVVPRKTTSVSDQDMTSKQPPAGVSPDREVAEWLIELGGRTNSRKVYSTLVVRTGIAVPVNSVDELPRGPFKIRSINLGGNMAFNDENIERLKALKGLRTLGIPGTAVTAAGLIKLSTIPRLNSINVTVGDADLHGLSHLPRLSSLTVNSVDVTDAGAKQLVKLTSVQRLVLRNTSIGDLGMRDLQKLTQLRHLDVRNTHVTQEAVREFQSRVPSCEVLWQK